MDDARKVGSSVVVVEVEDVNDNLPRFSQDVYSVSIIENLPTSFSVMQVSAADPDQVVSCSCSCSFCFSFSISSGGGKMISVFYNFVLLIHYHSLPSLSCTCMSEV